MFLKDNSLTCVSKGELLDQLLHVKGLQRVSKGQLLDVDLEIKRLQGLAGKCIMDDTVLQCVAVCRSVLQCVAVRCSVLQCVAVCCSVFIDVPKGSLVSVSSMRRL